MHAMTNATLLAPMPATRADALSAAVSTAVSTDASLHLPAELTIYTVAEIRSAWLPWLTLQRSAPSTDAAVVDACAVDQVDTAGVQLLASLALALTPRRLQLLAPSEPLRSACQSLGLQALLAEHAANVAAGLAPNVAANEAHA